jgi:hypothetical protein
MVEQNALPQQLGSEKEPAAARADAAVNVIAFPRGTLARRLPGFRSLQPKSTAANRMHPEGLLPVETLARYEGGAGEDADYRHRMTINMIAFVVCIGLIGAGLWIANTIADLRRDQDCVLAGRPNCAHISVAGKLR